MVVKKKFGEVAEMCPEHDLLVGSCLICTMEINQRSSRHIAMTILLAEKDARIVELESTLIDIRDELAKCIVVLSTQPEWLQNDFAKFTAGLQIAVDKINEALQQTNS